MRRILHLPATFSAVLALTFSLSGCATTPRALPTAPLRAPPTAAFAGIPRAAPEDTQTCPDLGAAQGVAVYHGKVYIYGDWQVGIVREYDLVRSSSPETLALRPTGRAIRLTRNGVNLLNHPTGLALHDGLPCFLGNTVTRLKQGRIVRLDFDRALADGNLDHAVLNDALDDLAIQGARPEYVRTGGGRFLLATSDYGRGPNFVRFFDPQRLATAQRTSEPGVLVKQVPCGPWVQSLFWADDLHTLVIIQNIIEGRQWRFTLVSDLDVPDYRTDPESPPGGHLPGAGVRVLDIAGHENELEGYARIRRGLGLFITSSRENNVTFAGPRSPRWVH